MTMVNLDPMAKGAMPLHGSLLLRKLDSILENEWGLPGCHIQILGGDSDTPLTHDASLFLIRKGEKSYVLKRRPLGGIQRGKDFHQLKFKILKHIGGFGELLPNYLATTHKLYFLVCDEYTFELCELVEGDGFSDKHLSLEDLYIGYKNLHSGLQRTPVPLSEKLQSMAIPACVEEPDCCTAIAQVNTLRKYFGTLPEWSTVLDVDLEKISTLSNGIGKHIPQRRSIVHGDLHAAHWIFTEDKVKFLDFDNLRVDDAALDFAWLLDSAALHRDPHQEVVAIAELAVGDGLFTWDEIVSGMKSLVRYAVPIVVDIGKDIYVRGDVRDVWRSYLEILNVGRKITLLNKLQEKLIREKTNH